MVEIHIFQHQYLGHISVTKGCRDLGLGTKLIRLHSSFDLKTWAGLEVSTTLCSLIPNPNLEIRVREAQLHGKMGLFLTDCSGTFVGYKQCLHIGFRR